MNLTALDWLIGICLILFIFLGYRKGFVQQLFDLLGSIFALVMGFFFYQRLGRYLVATFHCSVPLGNILGFVLIVAGIGVTVSCIGRYWQAAEKGEPIVFLDGLFGGIFGGLKAAVVWIILLLILAALPWQGIQKALEASTFADDLLRLAPYFYVFQDRSLPAELPRLVVSPEGLQLRKVQSNQLEGSTCIACGAKVHYRGLVRQGLSSYPQAVCPHCGRMSDGCLTFEGYHMIRGICPYEQLGSMGVTDCKVWPNPEPTTIKGRCPVCGRTQ